MAGCCGVSWRRLSASEADIWIALRNPVPAFRMPTRPTVSQLGFCYRSIDGATGVTCQTAKRLAEHLGVDETRAIRQAPHLPVVRVLP